MDPNLPLLQYKLSSISKFSAPSIPFYVKVLLFRGQTLFSLTTIFSNSYFLIFCIISYGDLYYFLCSLQIYINFILKYMWNLYSNFFKCFNSLIPNINWHKVSKEKKRYIIISNCGKMSPLNVREKFGGLLFENRRHLFIVGLDIEILMIVQLLHGVSLHN